MFITGRTCFDECFLFHAITGRYYILYKLSLFWDIPRLHCFCRPLKQMFWKMSVFYVCFLHTSITNLIPKIQNKVAVYCTCSVFWINCIFDNGFYTLSFCESTIRVPKVLFRVLDKLKSEIQESIIWFCFYLSMKNEILIIEYCFHV